MDLKFMKMALDEAKKAYFLGEVPVGCVIVKDGNVIAKAFNKKETLKSVTKHAEIIAVEKASRKLNNWRLSDCDLYVTLEPCPMCASCIKQARISNVYFGLSSKDKVSSDIVKSIFYNNYSNPPVNYSCGYLYFEISELVDNFFKLKR